jgi:hypothetical protein
LLHLAFILIGLLLVKVALVLLSLRDTAAPNYMSPHMPPELSKPVVLNVFVAVEVLAAVNAGKNGAVSAL